MNTPIKINKLICELKYDKINENYDFCKVTTTKNYFKFGASILDLPLMGQDVCSVCFLGGNSFYVMLKHNDFGHSTFIEALKKANESENIVYSFIASSVVPKHICIQLLLNNMCNFTIDSLRFNNISGHLYCVNPNWIKRGRENKIKKIISVEIKIKSDMWIDLSVRTFVPANSLNTKKSSPLYVLSLRNTLRRKLRDDKGEYYIMGSTRKKSSVDFLNFSGSDNFLASKMGLLSYIIEKFNDFYLGIARIDFEQLESLSVVEYKTKIKKLNEENVQMILKSSNIKIVDTIGNEDSKRFCTEISQILFNEYGIKSTAGKRIDKESFNIRIVHSIEYYEKEKAKDRYRLFSNESVQHIVYENFKNIPDAVIDSIIHQLIIKRDLIDGKISLFDWSSLKLDGTLSFGMQFGTKNSIYCFMDIEPDGTFKVSEQKFSLFEYTQYSDCISIFEDESNDKSKIEGIIKDANGNINIIKNTGLYTLPEICDLKEELLNGNTKLRNKEMRDKLLWSILDIKMFKDDNKYFYFVGTAGDGMQSSVKKSAIIREIELYNGSNLLFEKILPLMNVTFVRNGQLTVLPFPFKYLREYARIQGIDINSNTNGEDV